MDKRPFAGLSSDETAQTMLLLLAQILEKLPRVDAFDRLMINGSEIAPASTPVSGTVAVSAVTDLTRINAFGGTAATARPADAVPLHVSNVGAQHIYNNIIVS